MTSQDEDTSGSSGHRFNLDFLSALMESRGLPVPSPEELEQVELQVASTYMNQSQTSTPSDSPSEANRNSVQANDETGKKDIGEDFSGTQAATSKSAPENQATGTQDDLGDLPGTRAATSKSAPKNQESGTQDDVLKNALIINELMETSPIEKSKDQIDVEEPGVQSEVGSGNSSVGNKDEENIGGKKTKAVKGKRTRLPSTEVISSDGLLVSSSTSDSAPETEEKNDLKEQDSITDCKRKYDEIRMQEKENIPPTVPFPPPTPPHVKRRYRLTRPEGVRTPLATIFGGTSGVAGNNPGPSNAPPPRHIDSSDSSSSSVDEPEAKKPRCGIVQEILNPVPMRTSYVEARAEGVSFEEM